MFTNYSITKNLNTWYSVNNWKVEWSHFRFFFNFWPNYKIIILLTEKEIEKYIQICSIFYEENIQEIEK